MWLLFKGIPEEDQEIDRALGDERADLLVATEWAAQESFDGYIQFVSDEPAGRAVSVNVVLGEDLAIVRRPLQSGTKSVTPMRFSMPKPSRIKISALGGSDEGLMNV